MLIHDLWVTQRVLKEYRVSTYNYYYGLGKYPPYWYLGPFGLGSRVDGAVEALLGSPGAFDVRIHTYIHTLLHTYGIICIYIYSLLFVYLFICTTYVNLCL